MADVATAKPAKAPKADKTKKPAKPRDHPPTSEMVLKAIASLAEKKGSSLAAIKKYIAGTYKLDIEKQASFIRRYLKTAVEKKTIVQTKGVGASGRFKLPGKGEEPKVAKKAAPKKDKEAPAKKKPAAKPKKSTAPPKKAPKPKPAQKVKSPKSPKKTAAKPKVAKPKASTKSAPAKAKAAKK